MCLLRPNPWPGGLFQWPLTSTCILKSCEVYNSWIHTWTAVYRTFFYITSELQTFTLLFMIYIIYNIVILYVWENWSLQQVSYWLVMTRALRTRGRGFRLTSVRECEWCVLEQFENFKLDCTRAETGTDELLWVLASCVCVGLIGQAGMKPGSGPPGWAVFQAECGPDSHLTSALVHILICDVMPVD